MDGIKIQVTGNIAKVTEKPKRIIAGTIGLPVEFYFDETWDDIVKTAVFVAGENVSRLDEIDGKTTVPWEVLQKPGPWLSIGVYGESIDGEKTIPTTWANVSPILFGTSLSGDPTDPSAAPIWKKLKDEMENVRDLVEEGYISNASINKNGELELTFLDGSVVNVGKVVGETPAIADDLYTKDSDMALSANMGAALREKIDTDLLTVQKELQAEIKQRVKTVNGVAPDENGNVVVKAPEGGGGGIVQETDPTVPAWAKQPNKPSYTAFEVGARPSTWMPTAQEVGALPSTYTPPNQTADQVGADPKGTAANAVSQHNTADDSHNDIRLELKAINDRLTAFFDSDDQTLDELSEIVAYITSNKTLIDAITTSKVSVTDIINNLTTNVTNKPLSAAQGVTLKALIDAITVPTKVSQLTNDKGYLTQHQDISGKLDASALPSAINTALAQAKASGEFDGKDGTTPVKGVDYFDGTDGNDGHTPVRGVDYWTSADKAEIEAYLATELAKRGQLQPEYAESIDKCTDTTKLYVLPDGMIYAWMLTEKEVSSGGGYTNALDGVTININKRWSHSSKGLSSANGYATMTVPVTADKKVYVNVPRVAFLGNYPRIHYMDASNNYVTTLDRLAANAQVLSTKDGVTSWTTGYQCATAGDASTNARLPNADSMTKMVLVLNMYDVAQGTDGAASTTLGAITEADVANLIVSVGNPIEEGGTTIVKEYAWASTGLAFVPADYEDRIIELEKETAQNTADIATLKNGAVDTGGVDALTWIRNWDSPIYDRVPVFQLSAENPAVTSADKTVDGVYAKYDALMSANPRYITKTNMGMCSDGVTPVYRYDFREPEPHHQSGMQWSEEKPTIIIVSGIHIEWGGIYSLYYALKEITENPELDDLRRNVHFVVVPVMNPYCIVGAYSTNYGVQNANGVEIHRNFEVGFKYPGQSGYIEPGNRSHGGTAPLSEVESQYIDNLFKQYPDAALFLTCHSAQRDTRWGTGFIWASTATEYTCNLGYRLVDKLSKAWHKKYGKTWEDGCVRENNFVLADPTTYPNGVQLEAGDYRAGHAHVSSTNGTETRQATKYGIQGANVEVLDTFWVLSSTGLDSKLTTHGAEVYINSGNCSIVGNIIPFHNS